MNAMNLLENREYFYMLPINNNNNNKVQCVAAGRRVWRMKGQALEEGSRAGMTETR